jgi:hypothetical protein
MKARTTAATRTAPTLFLHGLTPASDGSRRRGSLTRWRLGIAAVCALRRADGIGAYHEPGVVRPESPEPCRGAELGIVALRAMRAKGSEAGAARGLTQRLALQ